MEGITQTQNLEAHYSTSSKVEKPKRVVVEGPKTIPTNHIYTDKEANERLAAINNDVYESVQNTPKKNKKKFLGIF